MREKLSHLSRDLRYTGADDFFTMIKSIVTTSLIAVLFLCGRAEADKVQDIVKTFKNSQEYKVRIDAALKLSKLCDQRATVALLSGLSDPDKTVRGVAAAGLSKVVNPTTKAKTRAAILKALKTLAEKDANPFVRKQALRAYERIKNPSSVKKPPICPLAP